MMKTPKPWFMILLGVVAAGAVEVSPKAMAQTAPRVEMVGEGTVSSTGDEYGGSLSLDGKTLYFSRSVPPSYFYAMCVSHLDKNGRWGKPEILPFSGQWRDSDPVLSPSGDQMVFVSDRPAAGESESENHFFRIWSSHKTGAGWSEPGLLQVPNIPSEDVYFASLANNGNLYFTALVERNLSLDVFRSRLIAGKYQEPEPLTPFNANGISNIEVFVAPDESYLLLGTFNRPDSLGSSDLYISYNRNGEWSKPKDLGPQINSPARDYSPHVSPDGKYLYFGSERAPEPAKHEGPMTYEEFVRQTRSVLNGLGNIYRVPMSYVFEVAKP